MADVLAEALVQFCTKDVASAPASATRIVELSLLDWVGVGLAGVKEPVSELIVEHANAGLGGAESASVFGLEQKLDPRQAALANGTISHALDYDDTHFAHVGHLSTVILPAALALVEADHGKLSDLKLAAVAGFESACRVGQWLGRAHYNLGFHQTATAGMLGAVVGCARAIGLDDGKIRSALGLASSRASGLKSQFGTMGKPINAGYAASLALESVQLAALGATSCDEPFAGLNGFGTTHHSEFQLEEALRGLGEQYVMEENQYKFHACCHGLHGVLEAFRTANHVRSAEEIAEVEVRANPQWMTVCNIAEPRTGLEAKFSYRMAMALALNGYDTGRLDTFSDELCARPEFVLLRNLVRVVPDDDLSELGGKVTIFYQDAESVKGEADLGDPLTPGIKRNRLHEKVAGLCGTGIADELCSLVEKDDASALADICKIVRQGI